MAGGAKRDEHSSSIATSRWRWPRQIQAHLERLIHERLLAPGVKLPATRELADSLGVNRATVALAYEELVAAGRARAHVGQGTFVAGAPASAAGAGRRRPRRPRRIDWSGLFSRSAQIIGADDERSPGCRRADPVERRRRLVRRAACPTAGSFPPTPSGAC